jgi:hypothetical protein
LERVWLALRETNVKARANERGGEGTNVGKRGDRKTKLKVVTGESERERGGEEQQQP